MQGYTGALGYEAKSTVRGFILISLLVFALLGATLAFPGVFKVEAAYGGMSDNSIFPVFIVALMFRAARKDTVFLTSRPIARQSIHLAILTYLAALAVILAAVLTIVQLTGYGINNILIDKIPRYYKRESDAMLWNPFYPSQTLVTFWNALKTYIVTGLFAYGYACFLTRWKGWTIGLSVGVPVLAFVLFVLPTIQAFLVDATGIIENGSSPLVMIALSKWVAIVRSVIDWFSRYFEIIYWSAAAAMIPLSFLVMRKTRHTA